MYDDVVKLLRLSFLIYYILSISFRVLFLEHYNFYSDQGAGLIFDYLADLFYLLDLILSSPRNNSIHPQGHHLTTQNQFDLSKTLQRQSLVVNRSQRNFRKKNEVHISHLQYFRIYLPHFILIFPFEVIGLLAGMKNYYVLRSIRLLRCIFFYNYWNDVADMLRYYNYAVTAGAQRVVVFTLILALVAHVAACIFYNIALNNLRQNLANNWLVVDNLAILNTTTGKYKLLESVSYRYVRAIYWSIQTLTTVGFGDIVAHSESETWFCIFYFLVIALLVSFTLANLTMAITNFDAAHHENLMKISRFEKYAAYRRLPTELTNRVVSYYEHQWKKLKGLDEVQVGRVVVIVVCLCYSIVVVVVLCSVYEVCI